MFAKPLVSSAQSRVHVIFDPIPTSRGPRVEKRLVGSTGVKMRSGL
jgi:hypothetical protein